MTIFPHDPDELFRVDITIGDRQTESVFFNATDTEASTEAQRIVSAMGGDSGDVYQYVGGGRGSYYETVTVK